MKTLVVNLFWYIDKSLEVINAIKNVTQLLLKLIFYIFNPIYFFTTLFNI